MRDLAEIVLLDFLLSQQDRVGNIDFVTLWHWVEGAEIRTRKAAAHGSETAPVPDGALRIKRTYLNDNDSGGRVEYANFAKLTGYSTACATFPHRPMPASWR